MQPAGSTAARAWSCIFARSSVPSSRVTALREPEGKRWGEHSIVPAPVTGLSTDMNVTNKKSAQILASLQTGFRTDCAHLEELEKDLALTLESAEQFGRRHRAHDAWDVAWQQHWEAVGAILRRIRVLVREMEVCTRDNAGDLLDTAVRAWEEIQTEDTLLVEALGSIRTQATTLDAAVRKDWNEVAQSLEPQLAKLHTCARVLRIKVELLRSHSPEGVDSIVQQLLSKLPGHSPAETPETSIPNQKLHEATMELEHEKHATSGLMGVVRGLLMWVETPAERAGENHAARTVEAAPSGALPLPAP
jgi:hypothetical protein